MLACVRFDQSLTRMNFLCPTGCIASLNRDYSPEDEIMGRKNLICVLIVQKAENIAYKHDDLTTDPSHRQY